VGFDLVEGRKLTKINHKLSDLKSGDPLLPGDPDSTGALEVVPVHDDVYGQVQSDWNPGNRSMPDELCVAKKRGGWVVIAVEKS